jgi:hypothetical protein
MGEDEVAKCRRGIDYYREIPLGTVTCAMLRCEMRALDAAIPADTWVSGPIDDGRVEHLRQTSQDFSVGIAVD